MEMLVNCTCSHSRCTSFHMYLLVLQYLVAYHFQNVDCPCHIGRIQQDCLLCDVFQLLKYKTRQGQL